MGQREIVYHVDPWSAWRSGIFFLLLALGGLVFLLLLGIVGVKLSAVSRAVAWVAGVACAAGFGTLALKVFRRLNSSEPYLVIGNEGLHDNASGLTSGAGWIAWSEIADVRLSRYHNMDCVELVPRDREEFLRRFGWLERLNRSSRLGYPAMAIKGPLLPVEPAVIVEEIRRYWREAGGGDS